MGALRVNLGRESGSHDAPLLFSVSYTSQGSPAGIATTLRDPPCPPLRRESASGYRNRLRTAGVWRLITWALHDHMPHASSIIEVLLRARTARGSLQGAVPMDALPWGDELTCRRQTFRRPTRARHRAPPLLPRPYPQPTMRSRPQPLRWQPPRKPTPVSNNNGQGP